MKTSNTEITEETIFGKWYGKNFFDEDVDIEDETLMKFLLEMSKAKNIEGHDSNLFLDLFNHAMNNDFITLPDGARFVRSLKAAKDQNWMDIYTTLSLAIGFTDSVLEK